MEDYKNKDSDVLGYMMSDVQLVVKFKNGDILQYTNSSNTRAVIDYMKRLAIEGKGLSTYIKTNKDKLESVKKIKTKKMKLFVFAYDTEADERENVIRFFLENNASQLKQCLNTTYFFKSENDVVWWDRKILDDLNLDYHLINEVKLGDRRNSNNEMLYELKKRCNPDLQDFVDEVKGRFENGE